MSFASMKNIGAFIKAMRASANTAATAGGAGDNTAITGVNPRSRCVEYASFRSVRDPVHDHVGRGRNTDL
jgi:hypothetical protein